MTVACLPAEHWYNLHHLQSSQQNEAAYYWKVRNTFLELKPRMPMSEADSDSESRGSSSKRSLSVDSGIAVWRGPVCAVADAVVSTTEAMALQNVPEGKLPDDHSVIEPHRITEADMQSEPTEPEQTTVVIRNIACRYMEADVKDILEHSGFGGKYESVYVPCSTSRARPTNLGYAFVKFSSVDMIEECRRVFEGKRFGPSCTAKRCEVTLAHGQRGGGHTQASEGRTQQRRLHHHARPGTDVAHAVRHLDE